jgi:hypothetical protein
VCEIRHRFFFLLSHKVIILIFFEHGEYSIGKI